jgi:hypothetical protein
MIIYKHHDLVEAEGLELLRISNVQNVSVAPVTTCWLTFQASAGVA